MLIALLLEVCYAHHEEHYGAIIVSEFFENLCAQFYHYSLNTQTKQGNLNSCVEAQYKVYHHILHAMLI